MPKAIPESWDAGSPTSNHTFNTDAFYDDSMTEQSRDSMFDDYGDESKLVRSASIGKKAKAALVDAKSAPTSQIETRNEARPDPVPVQAGFDGATRYVEASTSSSNTLPSFQPTPVATPDARTKGNQLGAGITMMNITEASSGGEALQSDTIPAPKPGRRLSAMKRPQRLDIDAVRAAEARGSITSLPDLIKRATRLASMIEKGNRPASKLDNLTDFLNDKAGVIGATDGSSNDRHQSGLSDMIAAFPPPGHPNARGEQSGTVGFDFRDHSVSVLVSSRPGGTGVDTSSVDDEEMDKSVEMRALPSSPAITAAPVLAMASGLPSLKKHTTSEEEPSSLLVDMSTTTDTVSPQATNSPLTKEAGDNSPEFNVTQEVLDFARVAVLYVLQEQSFDYAETAQSDLQRFFSDSGKGITERQAYNLTIGGSNTVNLVGYRLDLGEGVVGKSLTKRRAHSMQHLQK
ncbi:hypothetical protein N3K66_000658 [Trichothecium roseum]|uniref:Uncharacterized protein n=1 Tax=Trichothecium roseum TaxID=47278 RepID=A0ACC0VCV7_9HYPO|nr:hypothetical protein N3K66_000658 [Trichothecium roseum]